jgi:hypothetical protein
MNVHSLFYPIFRPLSRRTGTVINRSLRNDFVMGGHVDVPAQDKSELSPELIHIFPVIASGSEAISSLQLLNNQIAASSAYGGLLAMT